MNKAFVISIFIHLVFVIMALPFFIKDETPDIIKEKVEFNIVEKEVIEIKKKPEVVINAQKPAPKKEVKKPEKKKKKPRKVFGVKRKTITSEKGTVSAKVGNTLAKKEDKKVLQDDESDQLPAPAEEFLITSMPKAVEEFRPEYPKWAKEKKITGSVVFEILIDQNGKVRKATLIEGIHPELDGLAKEAMKKFKFRPAKIDNKPVAVKIRYAIKYLLQS